MAATVYALCALTALACATMLFRAYRQTRTRLLFWSFLCFIALTINNMLLFVDLVVIPDVDLSTLRTSVALAGLSLLLFGLVWDRP